MRIDRLILRLVVAVAVLGPFAGKAAGVELTPYVGYSSVDYDYEQELVCLAVYSDCVFRGESDDSVAFGLIVGFDLRPGWQLEVLANRRQADLDATARFISVSPGFLDIVIEEELDFDLTHYQVGVSRRFGAGTVHPFVGAAVGASRFEIDGAGFIPGDVERSDDALSASAGVGVKVDLTGRLALRLEGRGWWVDLDEEAGGELIQLDASAGLLVRW